MKNNNEVSIRDGELVLTSSTFDSMTEEERKSKMAELKAKRDELLKQLRENSDSPKNDEDPNKGIGK